MSLRYRLASKTAIIFATRIMGAGIIFALQALMARTWGAERLGEFLLIIATVNLVAMFLPLGFHAVTVYFAAKYSAAKDRATLTAFLGWSYGHIAATGLIALLLCAPITIWLGGPGELIANLATPVTFLAIASATVFVNLELLVGLKRPIMGYTPESVLRPILMMSAFAIAFLFTKEETALSTMLWIFACAYLGVAALQFWPVYQAVQQVPQSSSKKKNDLQLWWRFAIPWALIAVATDYFFDIDLIILAGLLSAHDLAVFGVCAKIFALIAFGITAVYALVLPDMCEADAKRDMQDFARKIGDANLVAAAAAALLVVGVAIGGETALQIFGETFSIGTWPLLILASSLLVRAVFGPASFVLSIFHRPSACLPAVALGVVSLFFLNIWLVPEHGLIGAAIAAFSAISIWSTALWFTALKVTGVNTSIYPRLKLILLNMRQEISSTP